MALSMTCYILLVLCSVSAGSQLAKLVDFARHDGANPGLGGPQHIAEFLAERKPAAASFFAKSNNVAPAAASTKHTDAPAFPADPRLAPAPTFLSAPRHTKAPVSTLRHTPAPRQTEAPAFPAAPRHTPSSRHTQASLADLSSNPSGTGVSIDAPQNSPTPSFSALLGSLRTVFKLPASLPAAPTQSTAPRNPAIAAANLTPTELEAPMKAKASFFSPKQKPAARQNVATPAASLTAPRNAAALQADSTNNAASRTFF